jgi:Flp pilus assembly protein TadG
MGRLVRLAARFRRSTRGGAAVELAIVLPILTLLVIGVADYGRVFFTSITVANAARAGAEYGAQSPAASVDTAGMRIVAQQDGNEIGAIDFSTTPPRTYCECAGASHGCTTLCTGGAAPDVFIEVTARKVVTMLFSYPGLPGSVTINRSATFRMQ